MQQQQAVDLFCGCGGLTQGLTDAGFQIGLGIDHNCTILETYRRNFRHKAVQHDLTDWEEAVSIVRRELPGCNVVVGSPPCTEFSRAGKQMEGDIASLTVAFAKIVTSLLPDFFIMENVPDVATSSSLQNAINIFSDYGYSVVSIIRDARYCGVPQNRRRFFMIGCAATTSNEDKLLRLVRDASARSLPVVGVKEYCEARNLPCPDFLYFFPRNKFQAQVVSSEQPYPTMRSTNGVCMHANPQTKNYVRRPNDAADLAQAETISIELASAISSFPVHFQWPENRKDVGIQLGNCVPPGLAEWVGRLVLKALAGIETAPTQNGRWICKPQKKNQVKTSHIQVFKQLITELGASDDKVQIKPIITNEKNDYNGNFRSSDVASNPQELFYTVGTDPLLDEAAIKTLGFPMKKNWTFHIKERICQASRIDDMFVLVPGQIVPFRGKAMLTANGLLP